MVITGREREREENVNGPNDEHMLPSGRED